MLEELVEARQFHWFMAASIGGLYNMNYNMPWASTMNMPEVIVTTMLTSITSISLKVMGTFTQRI
ncbi:unnamed protein product [Staurois parvus]|uniref:Uncharacterized protein n=1 Tax=Staurois parvus TaxID=386267 RepID=A0ABN9GQP0_9NEOB|nr:unnamed protein product [Staurois parvus]